jgi:protein-S-isoprenylcysteine O-methyltransferase Ste14
MMRLLVLLAGFAVLAAPRTYGQSEVDPDHFDSPNTEPFPQPKTKQGDAAEMGKVRFDSKVTPPLDSGVNQMNVETSVGVALAAISFALVVLARLQLGKSFSVTPMANDLVTHGLYSRLRHPMYLFVDLTVCGIALAMHRGHVLLVLIILLPLQTRNARTECKLLKEKFGERYEIYRRATWF